MRSIFILTILASLYSNLVKSSNYDYYVFSRSWVPGFCEFNTQGLCQNGTIGNKFTIHGLWPTWNNGSWPQYCCQETLDHQSMSNILNDLDSHWSDNGDIDWKLWTHEWQKHGTCAIGNPFINNSNDYFIMGLWLEMRLNVNYKLLTSNITPSYNISYPKSDLVNLLGASLVCKKKDDKDIITEIRNHISLDFHNIEPLSDDLSCGENPYLVPYIT